MLLEHGTCEREASRAVMYTFMVSRSVSIQSVI